MNPRMSLPREVPERIEDRLIVALDVPSIGEARELVGELDGLVSFFKVGLWLQFAAGFDGLLDELIKRGKKVCPVFWNNRHCGGPATYLRNCRTEVG